ncbi:MAG: acyloxyacyl hydrolase [Acidobacteriota bacterium]
MKQSTRWVLLCAATLLLTAVSASAQVFEPSELVVSAGVFNVLNDERDNEVGVELRLGTFELPLGRHRIPLGVQFGAMATEESAYYIYGSFRYDWWLSQRWRLTPFLGGGIYSAGDGKDLGGPVEFRSGLELSVGLTERSRLGLSFYHLSNGVLYDSNPGAESLVVVFSRRLGG